MRVTVSHVLVVTENLDGNDERNAASTFFKEGLEGISKKHFLCLL